jgi:hypothetical protein
MKVTRKVAKYNDGLFALCSEGNLLSWTFEQLHHSSSWCCIIACRGGSERSWLVSKMALTPALHLFRMFRLKDHGMSWNTWQDMFLRWSDAYDSYHSLQGPEATTTWSWAQTARHDQPWPGSFKSSNKRRIADGLIARHKSSEVDKLNEYEDDEDDGDVGGDENDEDEEKEPDSEG